MAEEWQRLCASPSSPSNYVEGGVMDIDKRVRASEFMSLLSIGRTKFYRMLKRGEIPKPIQLSEKDVFWYESQVKKEVEKYKQESDNIACT